MQPLDELLRQEVLAMATNDLSVRAELIAEGTLVKEGYHPRMEAVHKSNAAHLTRIIEQHGWPGKSLVGEDGAEAAWLIVQHSIGNPAFMRRCLSLLQQAGKKGDAPLWHAAMLEDRIRMYEGKPQIYGSQFQPDENGLAPYQIENPGGVNDRRRAVGLNSLEERTAELREQHVKEGMPLVIDRTELERRRKEDEEWFRATGWRA
ncbi:MAG: DUF6624 domain-containing protein [Candidatus Manganitrophaceae bacterium]